jgi:hypothetical protein
LNHPSNAATSYVEPLVTERESNDDHLSDTEFHLALFGWSTPFSVSRLRTSAGTFISRPTNNRLGIWPQVATIATFTSFSFLQLRKYNSKLSKSKWNTMFLLTNNLLLEEGQAAS